MNELYKDISIFEGIIEFEVEDGTLFRFEKTGRKTNLGWNFKVYTRESENDSWIYEGALHFKSQEPKTLYDAFLERFGDEG